MGKKGLKGHIALWALGRYTDDPRVHDFLNTMMYYSGGKIGIHWIVHRQPGLASFARAVIRAPFGYGKHLAPSRGVRVTSPHGEWPVKYQYTKSVKSPVHSVGPARAGTRAAAGRGSGLLMAGFLLYSLRPSFQFLRGEEFSN